MNKPIYLILCHEESGGEWLANAFGYYTSKEKCIKQVNELNARLLTNKLKWKYMQSQLIKAK